eukprot:m51a1_g14524 hypothetical protein (1845) ;mRNA; f:911883-918062
MASLPPAVKGDPRGSVALSVLDVRWAGAPGCPPAPDCAFVPRWWGDGDISDDPGPHPAPCPRALGLRQRRAYAVRCSEPSFAAYLADARHVIVDVYAPVSGKTSGVPAAAVLRGLRRQRQQQQQQRAAAEYAVFRALVPSADVLAARRASRELDAWYPARPLGPARRAASECSIRVLITLRFAAPPRAASAQPADKSRGPAEQRVAPAGSPLSVGDLSEEAQAGDVPPEAAEAPAAAQQSPLSRRQPPFEVHTAGMPSSAGDDTRAFAEEERRLCRSPCAPGRPELEQEAPQAASAGSKVVPPWGVPGAREPGAAEPPRNAHARHDSSSLFSVVSANAPGAGSGAAAPSHIPRATLGSRRKSQPVSFTPNPQSAPVPAPSVAAPRAAAARAAPPRGERAANREEQHSQNEKEPEEQKAAQEPDDAAALERLLQRGRQLMDQMKRAESGLDDSADDDADAISAAPAQEVPPARDTQRPRQLRGVPSARRSAAPARRSVLYDEDDESILEQLLLNDGDKTPRREQQQRSKQSSERTQKDQSDAKLCATSSTQTHDEPPAAAEAQAATEAHEATQTVAARLPHVIVVRMRSPRLVMVPDGVELFRVVARVLPGDSDIPATDLHVSQCGPESHAGAFSAEQTHSVDLTSERVLQHLRRNCAVVELWAAGRVLGIARVPLNALYAAVATLQWGEGSTDPVVCAAGERVKFFRIPSMDVCGDIAVWILAGTPAQVREYTKREKATAVLQRSLRRFISSRRRSHGQPDTATATELRAEQRRVETEYGDEEGSGSSFSSLEHEARCGICSAAAPAPDDTAPFRCVQCGSTEVQGRASSPCETQPLLVYTKHTFEVHIRSLELCSAELHRSIVGCNALVTYLFPGEERPVSTRAITVGADDVLRVDARFSHSLTLRFSERAAESVSDALRSSSPEGIAFEVNFLRSQRSSSAGRAAIGIDWLRSLCAASGSKRELALHVGDTVVRVQVSYWREQQASHRDRTTCLSSTQPRPLGDPIPDASAASAAPDATAAPDQDDAVSGKEDTERVQTEEEQSEQLPRFLLLSVDVLDVVLDRAREGTTGFFCSVEAFSRFGFTLSPVVALANGVSRIGFRASLEVEADESVVSFVREGALCVHCFSTSGASAKEAGDLVGAAIVPLGPGNCAPKWYSIVDVGGESAGSVRVAVRLQGASSPSDAIGAWRSRTDTPAMQPDATVEHSPSAAASTARHDEESALTSDAETSTDELLEQPRESSAAGDEQGSGADAGVDAGKYGALGSRVLVQVLVEEAVLRAEPQADASWSYFTLRLLGVEPCTTPVAPLVDGKMRTALRSRFCAVVDPEFVRLCSEQPMLAEVWAGSGTDTHRSARFYGSVSVSLAALCEYLRDPSGASSSSVGGTYSVVRGPQRETVGSLSVRVSVEVVPDDWVIDDELPAAEQNPELSAAGDSASPAPQPPAAEEPAAVDVAISTSPACEPVAQAADAPSVPFTLEVCQALRLPAAADGTHGGYRVVFRVPWGSQEEFCTDPVPGCSPAWKQQFHIRAPQSFFDSPEISNPLALTVVGGGACVVGTARVDLSLFLSGMSEIFGWYVVHASPAQEPRGHMQVRVALDAQSPFSCQLRKPHVRPPSPARRGCDAGCSTAPLRSSPFLSMTSAVASALDSQLALEPDSQTLVDRLRHNLDELDELQGTLQCLGGPSAGLGGGPDGAPPAGLGPAQQQRQQRARRDSVADALSSDEEDLLSVPPPPRPPEFLLGLGAPRRAAVAAAVAPSSAAATASPERQKRGANADSGGTQRRAGDRAEPALAKSLLQRHLQRSPRKRGCVRFSGTRPCADEETERIMRIMRATGAKDKTR